MHSTGWKNSMACQLPKHPQFERIVDGSDSFFLDNAFLQLARASCQNSLCMCRARVMIMKSCQFRQD